MSEFGSDHALSNIKSVHTCMRSIIDGMFTPPEISTYNYQRFLKLVSKIFFFKYVSEIYNKNVTVDRKKLRYKYHL